MAFTRKFLTDHGVPEDQVDAIMMERNRTLADYVPKSDLQSQIDTALEEARKAEPQSINVQETEEYKALSAELAKTKAFASDDFSSVKPKFRDTVWGLLDPEKPVSEQLPEIAKNYEEYFSHADPSPAKPQFGSPDTGGMPKGKTGNSLGELWGFGKK